MSEINTKLHIYIGEIKVMAALSGIVASFFRSQDSKYLIVIFATIPIIRGFIF